MVNNLDNNEHINADILRCRADILRAADIIPPYDEKPDTVPESEDKGETSSRLADISENPKQSVDKQTEMGPSEQQDIQIPKFDLAEEIMAEQRKITAEKRKSPGKKADIQPERPKPKSIQRHGRQTVMALPQREKIIEEIVARDIERLCSSFGVPD